MQELQRWYTRTWNNIETNFSIVLRKRVKELMRFSTIELSKTQTKLRKNRSWVDKADLITQLTRIWKKLMIRSTLKLCLLQFHMRDHLTLFNIERSILILMMSLILMFQEILMTSQEICPHHQEVRETELQICQAAIDSRENCLPTSHLLDQMALWSSSIQRFQTITKTVINRSWSQTHILISCTILTTILITLVEVSQCLQVRCHPKRWKNNSIR